MTRNRIWGLVTVVAALLLWGITFVIVVLDMRTAATWRAPGTVTMRLEPGTWIIAQHVPIDTSATAKREDAIGRRTVNVDQLTVSGPAGASPPAKVPISCLYCAKSEVRMPLDLSVYAGIGTFNVSRAGTYQITASGGAAQLGVADPVATIESGSAWWFSTFVAGLFVFAAGIGLIIRQPQRSARPAVMQGSAEPKVAASGWYPDPYGPEFERWWDGKRWTDHRR